MRYGYFDEQNKEYVIDRPDTPAPWANYLGSPEYGAIISNNAGGYSFEKSGANGRILRYIFNSFDQPGRYVYLRDDDTKDYWSASWQPVGKSLDVYKSECHHGTAYTKMYAEYSDIKSEVMYYVPLNKTHEVWKVRVTNNSDKPRNLSAIGYCEFTNDCNYEQDQVNLQYTLFITRPAPEFRWGPRSYQCPPCQTPCAWRWQRRYCRGPRSYPPPECSGCRKPAPPRPVRRRS